VWWLVVASSLIEGHEGRTEGPTDRGSIHLTTVAIQSLNEDNSVFVGK
jgi:hypothetical protein